VSSKAAAIAAQPPPMTATRAGRSLALRRVCDMEALAEVLALYTAHPEHEVGSIDARGGLEARLKVAPEDALDHGGRGERREA